MKEHCIDSVAHRMALFVQGAGRGVWSASHPSLQGPFLEGRNSLKSYFRVVALVLVSLLRSQTKVPSNDDCEKPFGMQNWRILCGLVGFWLVFWTLVSSGLRLELCFHKLRKGHQKVMVFHCHFSVALVVWCSSAKWSLWEIQLLSVLFWSSSK